MTKLLSLAAFLAGLATVGWIGAGYLTSHFLALCITLLIAAFYLVGALELRRFSLQTVALGQALAGVSARPERLEDWLASVPQVLRAVVRQRVEGTRSALPGPVLTPYLTGLLVLLGMLGTFGGMVVALHGTGAALAGADGLAAIRDALSAPVQGLGLAFGTSVAGVAASAMLGLIGALCRRERLAVAQQLDAALAGPLRSFSPEHQRETSLRLLEQQSVLWPQVVEGIQACMGALERQQQALNDRLAGDQARFFEHTATAYGGLAASVEKALATSAADSAQRAALAVQPAIESALAGLAQESARLQSGMAEQVRGQLEGMAAQLGHATAAVSGRWAEQSQAQAANWQQMLEAHARTTESLVQGQARALAQAGEQLAQTQQMQQQTQAEAQQQQQAQWAQALESMATTLQAQWQQVGDSLARTAAGIETGAQTHASTLLAQLAQHAARDAQQQQAWREGLQAQAQQLQDQWQEAGGALVAQHGVVSEALAQAAAAVQRQAEAQVQQVLTRLDARAEQDGARLDTWRAALQAQGAQLHQQWQHAAAALAEQQHTQGAQTEAQLERLLAQVEQRAAQDAQRLQAWTQALQAQTAALQQEWQQAGQAVAVQQQAVGDALARTVADLGVQAEARMERLLDQVAQRTGQDEQRLQAWTQTLQARTATLQQEWQQAGQVATAQQQAVGDALARTAAEMAQSLQAQAQATVGEVARLVQVASEAPRAAADMIGELREKLSDSMVRDNAVLEERSRMLQTLSTLLDGVNHAAQEQRGAIDALVASSTACMEQASQQFAQTLQSQSGVLVDAATQVQAGALEVSSLGEAFASAVEVFGQNNAQMLAQLQRIEAAMGKSLARSDEQLEYYVAQAREVIELSIGAQKQVMDGLQQLALPRAEGGAA